MRAQVATEYIILIGAILIVLIPILYYSSYQSTTVLTLNEAEDAVNTLVKTADYVYSLGPGTRSIALITIPGGASNSSVSEREIILNMSKYGEVVAVSKANLTGSFPYSKGTYQIPVTLLDKGVVLIGGSICNNNNICEYPEDCSNCPLDCGCSDDEDCCSGVCFIPACGLDSDCDDNDACTIDTCENPNSCLASCSLNEITSCFNDDGCCPTGCNSENDNDCSDGNETEEINCGDNICSSGEDCFSCAFDCECGEEPEDSDEEGTALKDVGIDSGIYSKTNGNGLDTLDSEMVATSNITLDLLDDNVNTPSTTSVTRTRSGNKYESFNVEINQDSSQYSKIVLYGRVRIIDVSPFQLRIYPYLQDKDGIDTTNYKDFAINDEILNQKVKWVELDITDIVKTQDNFGFIKTRVTSLNAGSQDNKRFQFSELHYKVG